MLASACQPVTPSGYPYWRAGAAPLSVAEGDEEGLLHEIIAQFIYELFELIIAGMKTNDW